MAGRESAHGNKIVKKLFKQIEQLGFTIIHRKNTYVITPPKHITGRVYYTHGTIQCVKPLKADFKKLYNVELD